MEAGKTGLHGESKRKRRERMIAMASIKKRFLAGILAGAVLITGALGSYAAQAAERPAEDRMERGGRWQMPEFDAEKAAKFIAERFGVKESEVRAALDGKRSFHDIGHAALLSKISGKPFREILAMKPGWQDVEKSLGISQEQIRAAMGEMMAAEIAKKADLSAEAVTKLLKDGYRPRDIAIAGKLAKASGKDVSDVLKRKTINNRWGDVAKELGVDENAVKSAQGFGPGFGSGMMGHGQGFGPGSMGDGEEEQERIRNKLLEYDGLHRMPSCSQYMGRPHSPWGCGLPVFLVFSKRHCFHDGFVIQ